MIKASIGLQDLRRKIYLKAKSDKTWRFWGLYIHVCKMETLQLAYREAKKNNGAPGLDGVSFADIEKAGLKVFLEQIQNELHSRTYRPMRNRIKEIPKGNGKVRTLGIPGIRDRVVQGVLKLILEPIFEADFQEGSYGYRPKRTAHAAIDRVAAAVVKNKTRVIDLDLSAYFDNVQHTTLMKKVAERVNDDDVMRLLKLILKVGGAKGVPQGGVISPLLSNIYLNEVDRMLQRAQEVTSYGEWTAMEYVRFADDVVVLVDWHPHQAWLFDAVQKRLREELDKLQVELNEEKSRVVDLARGECFGFLGFDFRRVRTPKGRWMPLVMPQMKKRTELLRKLKGIFKRSRSQPLRGVIEQINPILRGWVNYFAIGNSSRCFSFVRLWVEKKIRRLLAKARQRQGFGWKRWSSRWLYERLGLFDEYKVRWRPTMKASPA